MDNRQETIELGTKPVGKLLVQYAIPAIIAMTASSLYNTIDSIFIGQGVGPLAISGLAITFPLMNLTAAFGAAIGIGASTCLSVKFGQKDYATATRILGNSITLNSVVGIIIGAFCLIFLSPILRFFGASYQTLPYAYDYMKVILLGNPITQIYFGLNYVMRATGKPRHAMAATILTVVLNVVLAPLFIWVFKWGIEGAAAATLFAQITALVWQVHIVKNKKNVVHFTRGTYRLKADIVRNILSVGMSPFAMNVCACVVVIFINHGMVKYGGDLAVGAYGIVNKVAFMFIMINMGLNQGMQPIAGYNYGAQRIDRLMRVLKLAMIASTVILTTGFFLAMFLPEPCARLFTRDEQLIALSVHGIRIVMMMFPIVGCQMVIANFFMSIGKAKVSMFMALSRQLLFLLPMLIVLPPMFGVNGVWAAMPAADAVSAIVAGCILMTYLKKLKKQNTLSAYEQQ